MGHYLLECPNYENEREIMRKRIFCRCGIAIFGLNMLLDTKKEEDFKEWRNTILSHLENYVVETRRFATKCQIKSPAHHHIPRVNSNRDYT